MIDFAFKVITHNIGGRLNDYGRLCLHWKVPKADMLDYDEVQRVAAERLIDAGAVVYCLQEVGHEDRPLIQALKDRKFKIIHVEDNEPFDCAIALDTERFENITNHSMRVEIAKNYTKDVAIATAVDRCTKKSFVFVSAYVPGFDLARKTIDPRIEPEILDGDRYCQAIVQKLSAFGKGFVQIVGADTNAIPEKWLPRFHIFTDQGFAIQRTNASTNVNPFAEALQEREIDFIFTKALYSLWERIKSVFISTLEFHFSILNQNPLGWGKESFKTNASDHIPVVIEVSAEWVPSTISQLWNRLFSRSPVELQAIDQV